MALDLATAQTYLDAWLGAQVQLASNTTYTVSFPNGTSRTVTRPDGEEIRQMITYWHRVVNALSANAAGARNPTVTIPSWS